MKVIRMGFRLLLTPGPGRSLGWNGMGAMWVECGFLSRSCLLFWVVNSLVLVAL